MVYWTCTRWISSNNVWIWVCDATIALPAGSGTWCPESVPMCDQCTAHDGSGPNTRGTAGFLYVKGCKIWQHAIIGWETLRNLPQCTMDIHGLHNACRRFAAVLVFILLQGFVMERSVLADALNASGGLCPLSGHVYAVSRSTQNHWSASSGETFCRHRVHLKVWALLHQCKRHLLRNCPKSCYPVPWMSMRVTFSDDPATHFEHFWIFLSLWISSTIHPEGSLQGFVFTALSRGNRLILTDCPRQPDLRRRTLLIQGSLLPSLLFLIQRATLSFDHADILLQIIPLFAG